MKHILIISICFLTHFAFNQQYKPFEGILTYSVEQVDSTLKKAQFISLVHIYTNDTLVRTDSESASLGKQTLLRHLGLQKQYVLLEFNSKKYAIQEFIPKDTSASKYIFELTKKKKKIAGVKSQQVVVKSKNYPFPLKCYFTNEYNPIYLDILKGIPGLPTLYYVATENGLLRYTLRKMEPLELPSTTFLFSKDYERISFSEFIEKISK
jgi:hypothetical protein